MADAEPGADEAERAVAALRACQFDVRKLRVVTDEQILADGDEANRAIRGLAGCAPLHIRHHGHRRQSDFHLHRRTA